MEILCLLCVFALIAVVIFQKKIDSDANQTIPLIKLKRPIDIRFKCVKTFWGRRKIVPVSISEQKRIKAEILKVLPDNLFYDDLGEENSLTAKRTDFSVNTISKIINIRFKYKTNMFGTRVQVATSTSEQRTIKKAFLKIYPDAMFLDNLGEANSVKERRKRSNRNGNSRNRNSRERNNNDVGSFVRETIKYGLATSILQAMLGSYDYTGPSNCHDSDRDDLNNCDCDGQDDRSDYDGNDLDDYDNCDCNGQDDYDDYDCDDQDDYDDYDCDDQDDYDGFYDDNDFGSNDYDYCDDAGDFDCGGDDTSDFD